MVFMKVIIEWKIMTKTKFFIVLYKSDSKEWSKAAFKISENARNSKSAFFWLRKKYNFEDIRWAIFVAESTRKTWKQA